MQTGLSLARFCDIYVRFLPPPKYSGAELNFGFNKTDSNVSFQRQSPRYCGRSTDHAVNSSHGTTDGWQTTNIKCLWKVQPQTSITASVYLGIDCTVFGTLLNGWTPFFQNIFLLLVFCWWWRRVLCAIHKIVSLVPLVESILHSWNSLLFICCKIINIIV